MKAGWNFWNSSSGVNDDCIAHYSAPEDMWHCIFAPYTYPFIKSPLFLLNSRFDSYQVGSILGVRCNPNVKGNCSATQIDQMDGYGKLFYDTIAPVLQSSKDGVFITACYTHQQETALVWDTIKIQNSSINTAFAKWYNNVKIKLVDNCDFPCNDSCPTSL